MLDPKHYPMLGGECGCPTCKESKTTTLADLQEGDKDGNKR